MTTPFSTNILGEGTPQLRFNIDFSLSKWNTIGTHQLLGVTGLVRIRFYLFCTSNLNGGSTLSVGVTSNTSFFGSFTTSTWSSNEFMCLANNNQDLDTKATTYYQDRATENQASQDVVVSEDLEIEIVTSALTGGKLQLIGWWQKLSANGGVSEGDGT